MTKEKIQPVQLQLDADPYKIVLIGVMLQLAKWTKSLSVYQDLIKKLPTIAYFIRAKDADIIELIKSLGLARKRLSQYRKIFSWVDIHGWPKDKEQLALMPAGRYIKDCYQIFVLKDLNLVPSDKVLKAYVMQETGQTILPSAIRNGDVMSVTFDVKA